MNWNPSEAELRALKEAHAPEASDAEFLLWVESCKQRGLSPVTDVVLQTRKVSEWDPEVRAKTYKKKSIQITTIAALRKLAERTGQYRGAKPSTWIYLDDKGAPTLTSHIPLPDPKNPTKWREPWLVEAFVLREGYTEPQRGIARWGAYAQTTKFGDAVKLTSMWAQRGPEQLEKCAKAQALRETFPEELSGLYTDDELGNDEVKAAVEQQGPAPAEPATPPPTPVAAPAPINQEPATPTEEPRPGETRKKSSKNKAEAKKEPATANDPPVKPAPSETGGPDDMEAPLPENGQTQPAPTAKAPEAEKPPANDDRRKYLAKLLAYGPDKKTIGAWLKQFTGRANANDVTESQWQAAFAKLDANAELGAGALDSLMREAVEKENKE